MTDMMTSGEQTKMTDEQVFETCVRPLIYRFAQITIQSRQNRECLRVAQEADFFRLEQNVPDPNVNNAVKNLFAGIPLDLSRPVNIEIYTMNDVNEKILLEYFWLKQTSKKGDCNMGFYYDIQLLLKKLMAICRCNPVYYLVRNGSPSTRICYRIQFGEPKLYPETDYVQGCVGITKTPTGSVEIYSAYKPQPTPSTRRAKTLLCDIQENYFASETNSNRTNDAPKSKMPVKVLQSNDNIFPFANPSPTSTGEKQTTTSFASKIDSDDVPFAALFQHARSSPICSRRKRQESGDGIEIIIEESLQDYVELEKNSKNMNCSRTIDAIEDFVMVPLDLPFAKKEEDELGHFYHECQIAPMLSMFEECVRDTDIQETLSTINEQLARFEENASNFNEFVNSLHSLDL